MTPSKTVLFYITPESINEMLHFKPTQPLASLSMGFLLEQGPKLPNLEITRIAQSGRQWTIDNYSPVAVAQRFINLIKDYTPISQ